MVIQYSMKKIILISAIIICICPSFIGAQEVITKSYCLSALDHTDLDVLKAELLINAKRQAVNELFGEMITASSRVENMVLDRDKIQTMSLGYLRIKGNPVYQNGKNLGDVCVTIQAYVDEEDYQRLKPLKVEKKYCAANPEFSTKQLKQSAREQAIVSALTDYNWKLGELPKPTLFGLLHQIKYVQAGFIPDTETYCVSIEGLIYPIEIMTIGGFSENDIQTGCSAEEEVTGADIVASASSMWSGEYVPAKATDGDLNTGWWAAQDHHQGEWLLLEFPSTKTVKKLSILNGFLPDFYNNARIKNLKLIFSDGKTRSIELSDGVRNLQDIPLDNIKTSYIKLVVEAIYPGQQYNAAGINEVKIFSCPEN